VLVQSETCGFSVPEIELVLEAGTLGGRFTTLEGILDQIYEELSSKVFSSEDAVDKDNSVKLFLTKLQNVRISSLLMAIVTDDHAVEAVEGSVYCYTG
jgi:zinc finger protein